MKKPDKLQFVASI